MSRPGGHGNGGGSFALTTSASTTPEIDISQFSSGQVYVPTGVTAVTLTYHVAPGLGQTYLPAQDASGAAVTQTVAQTKAYPIPAILFGAYSMKIVANAADTVIISLKT